MTFDQYQTTAYSFALPKAKNELYMFTNLAGEVGEACSIVAKAQRAGTTVDTRSLKKELGDILWMVAGIASLYGINLSDVASSNISKLDSRKNRGVLLGNGDDR